MDRDRFARAQSIFHCATAMPAEERARFVERECGEDRELQDEVVSLLSADADTGDFLAEPALGDAVDLAGAMPTEPESSPDPVPDRSLGGILGDFRLIDEIGRGGMGVVYEAEQLSLGRRVALKVLPAHLTHQADAIERFRREAKTVAALDHPGIVSIHAVGEAEGTLYFAMERVEGISLDRLIAAAREAGLARPCAEILTRAFEAPKTTAPHGPWLEATWTEIACRLTRQIARSLEHAHAAGVLHRDVKPSNILVRPDGSAVLTDFGLARADSHPALTRTGQLAGTPEYLSPEQAEGRPAETRSDLFSLGVVLYELVTLHRPFQGKTAAEILARLTTKEPVAPRRLNTQVPPDLETIVLTLLEKDPRRRYANSVELAADLTRFLEYRPVQARPVGPMTRALRWTHRNPWIAAAIVGPVVLVIGGLTAFSIHQVGVTKEIRLEKDRAEKGEREAEAAAERVREVNARLAYESGRRAAQQGDWEAALSAYRIARDSGHPDPVEVELAMIEAWEGNFETERAREAIDHLATREDLGEHSARVWLIQGVLRIYDREEREEGRGLLEQALASESLEPAEQALAHALLAENLELQRRFLHLAVRKDPSLHRAYVALGNLLLVLGRFDEARDHVAGFRARFPDDPVALHLEAACLFIDAEDEGRGQAIIQRFERNGRHDVARFLEMYSMIVGLGDELDQLMLEDALALSWPGEHEVIAGATRTMSSLSLFSKAVAWLKSLEGTRSKIAGANVLVVVPPELERAVGQSVVAAIVAFAFISEENLEKALVRVDRVLEQYPVGIVWYLRAMLAVGLHRFDEAESNLQKVIDTPSPVTLRRVPLFLLLYLQVCDYLDFVTADPARARTAAAAAADTTWRILRFERHDAREFAFLGRAARYIGDLELATGIASRWRLVDPEDAGPWLALSKIAARRGDLDAAARYLDDARRLEPEGPEVLSWRAELESRDGGR